MSTSIHQLDEIHYPKPFPQVDGEISGEKVVRKQWYGHIIVILKPFIASLKN